MVELISYLQDVLYGLIVKCTANCSNISVLRKIRLKVANNVLGVPVLSVKSNLALRETRGWVKIYCMVDLMSIDMAIYDSTVIFKKINAYHCLGP